MQTLAPLEPNCPGPAIEIAIDAQTSPARGGGVAHALIALVRSLAELEDGNERYRLIVKGKDGAEFWRPELGANQSLIVKASARDPGDIQRASRLRRAVAILTAPARALLARTKKRSAQSKSFREVAISDGFYESLGCHVMHFATQPYAVCALPTVYNPHDLQHLHLPQFFKPSQIAWREATYFMGCRCARTVVVGSNWAKEDVVRQYSVDPAKVQVIAEGPQMQLSAPVSKETSEQIRKRYQLPEVYLLYPAMMWPHKNHIRLLEAVAILRRTHDLVISLVFTGTKFEKHWPQVEKRILELKLERQVHCLGFVPDSDLRAIQKGACGVVQPSLFEASSLPIYDAWLEGIPVACSRAAALPEQVGDAALLFDPFDPEDIAGAIAEIMTKPQLRDDLRSKGFRRLKDFDWSRTAKCYRAVYRRAANVRLTEEDRWLLQWDWMREPQRKSEYRTF
jgi:glycosyltransferase involved in cell wall biosynthesis